MFCYVTASSYFKICHKSDPNIADCIKRSLTDAAPKLIKGKWNIKDTSFYFYDFWDQHNNN